MRIPDNGKRSTATEFLRTPKKILAKKTKKATVSGEELQSHIALKAYSFYEQRGYTHGSDLGDWFEAERLVKEELGVS